ncbi:MULTISPECIES: Gfo/Idh/MocA family oxidoreductase [unclassified Lentimonas]|uniref:Gfo/Idh/MocA family oxidoreductase n=1 Tax=unclassified Lentimonas TaxID=2630993 RepID=UPI00132A33DE|nr:MULTISPECIES: Gfo/Idh/MocA family oxidoreductase [unclassified Lentimonas]CAA6693573.1 putative dehydrogenase [Lentimonas sp. CC19]CAA6695921.1 putative dehydrogenase [Lentimonas sp. CC10]CAA7069817.1 putative dehydrogenase [Lentimonas sp. CC11]
MHHNKNHTSRRHFLKSSAALGALTILPSYVALGAKSSTGLAPSEKVNVALVGIGNRANGNRKSLYNTGLCNVVALCDIDPDGAHTQEALYQHGVITTPPSLKKGQAAPKVFPIKARFFTDFRKMFDAMSDDIDAVVITTPDHSHFAVTMLAMSLGKHVYVEKPLAHTFGQCERMMDLAARSRVVTQMGNQGHSGANYFQFKAWSEAGLIKDVTRITAHMNRPRRWHGWGKSMTAYPSEPLPEGINWDQWIDSAHKHPYSTKLHPQEWRSWYDYGCGCFGDWGPHILDTSHRFLKLGLPETVTAVHRDGINQSDLIYPDSSTIRFDFPERQGMPACEVTWYDGVNNKPFLEGEYTDDGQPLELNKPGKVIYSKDLVFQGGSHSAALQIVPRQKYMDMRRDLPTFSQKNSDHQTNFLLACKGEEVSRSPFNISGELTQVFNLGILAQRLGGELTFDRSSKQVTNNPTAQALLDPAPRKGWEEFYAL